MKTKLLYFCLGVFAIAAIAAQLQTYPQVTVLGATDLIPFSQNQGGGNFNSPVNITAQNFANQLAVVGGYPMLNANQQWTGTENHTGSEQFTGDIIAVQLNGPPGSLIFANSGFRLRAVTLGPNIFLDAGGNLTITTNVSTNNIPLPVPVVDGGTGVNNAPGGLFNLGGARLDGTTQFPNLLDQGPATNQLMVLEQLPNGQQFTAIGNAPANGYYLGWTNVTPGVAWFPPIGVGTTNTGVTTITGYTNTNPFTVEVSVLSNGLTTFTMNDGVRDWVAYASVAQVFEFELGPGWSYRGSSFLVGNWHAIPQ